VSSRSALLRGPLTSADVWAIVSCFRCVPDAPLFTKAVFHRLLPDSGQLWGTPVVSLWAASAGRLSLVETAAGPPTPALFDLRASTIPVHRAFEATWQRVPGDATTALRRCRWIRRSSSPGIARVWVSLLWAWVRWGSPAACRAERSSLGVITPELERCAIRAYGLPPGMKRSPSSFALRRCNADKPPIPWQLSGAALWLVYTGRASRLTPPSFDAGWQDSATDRRHPGRRVDRQQQSTRGLAGLDCWTRLALALFRRTGHCSLQDLPPPR